MATRRSPDQAAFEAALRQNLRQRARLVTGTAQDVVQRLRTAAGALAALLAEQPAEWQQWQVTSIQAQVQALLDGLQGDLAGRVDEALRGAWALGQAAVDAPLAAANIHVGIYLQALDASVLTSLRSYTEGRIKDLVANAAAAVDQAVHLTVLGAQTPGQAIAAVKAAIGGPDAAAQARARRIVNTSVSQAYSVATQARQEQAAKVVPDMEKQWLRSGKIHSRWGHDAMDGVHVPVAALFQVPSSKGSGTVPMKHPHDPKAPPEEVINCGCTVRSWLSRWGLKDGGTPFTEREVQLNPMKAAAAAWKAGRRR